MSVSVPLIHPHSLLFKLFLQHYIREAQGQIVHWSILQFVLNRSFSVWLICLHPPEIKWPFESAAAHEFLSLYDGNGFDGKLWINVYYAMLNRYTSMSIERNRWVLGFVVMGTVRPVTQRWHEVDSFVLYTGFCLFLSNSLKFIFLNSWAWK